MNIIELLKQQVTAKVLQGDNQFQDEKIGALSAFYPILLTVLKSKPELIDTLRQNLNPRLTDIFSHNPETVNHFLGLVGGDAPAQEVENTLNHSIAPTLSLLADQAGTDDKQGIFDLIKAQWDNIQGSLPAWATGLFTTLGLSVAGLGLGGTLGNVGGALGGALGGVGDKLGNVGETLGNVGASVKETVTETASKIHDAGENIVNKSSETISSAASTVQNKAHEVVNEAEKKSNWLLPIITLLVLAAIAALLFKQCSSKPPVAGGAVAEGASQAVADLQAAELNLTTDAQGNLATVTASSSSQSLLDKLKASIGTVFGNADALQATANPAYAADLPDQNAIDQVLAKIKGLPNVSLAWIGNQLTIQSPDLAQAQKLADELKGLVPNLQVSASQSTDAGTANTGDATTNVDASNSQADAALSSIQADKANVNDIASALNLQVINFATGSAGIPDANKAILDKAAGLLKQLPDAKLVVKGFTDNVGNPDSNKALSEKRAKSVVAYLVEKGASAGQLTAEGHGQDNPIADNSTKEGQFKNRRIEFEVAGATTP